MSDLSACAFAAAALLLGRAIQINNGFYDEGALLWLTAALAATVGGVYVAGRARRPDATGRRTLVTILSLGVALQFAQIVTSPPLMYAAIRRPIDDGWFATGLIILAALAAVAAAIDRLRIAAFALLVAVHIALGVWVVRASPNPAIDVVTVQREAIRALVDGRSPYSITFPDIYEGREAFYPPDQRAGGRVLFGLPYPPLSLLMAVPGEVLAGDFRYGAVAAIAASAVAIASLGWTSVSVLAAVVLLTTPRIFFVIEQGWTEPFALCLASATIAAAWRSSRAVPVALGLALGVKQYVGVMLAGVLLLPQRETRSRAARVALAVAVGTAAPFFIWDPAGFLRSVVLLQFDEPFRTDSLSYLAWLARQGIAPPQVVATVVAGAGALAFALWRLPNTASGMAALTALTTLGLFAFGKKAFCNYYFFVIAMLCLAAAAHLDSTRFPSRDR